MENRLHSAVGRLVPGTIAAIFGDIPHQVVTPHALRDVVQAALFAVAEVRKGLTTGEPRLRRVRPTKAARRAARRKQCIGQKAGASLEHQYLSLQRTTQPG